MHRIREQIMKSTEILHYSHNVPLKSALSMMKATRNYIQSDTMFVNIMCNMQACGRMAKSQSLLIIQFYYIKVSGIASGNKLIKTIRYPHM